MAKPGRLTLGVAPGIALCTFGSCRQIDLFFQMPDQPRHAMRLHGGKRGIQSSLVECTNLVEGTRGKHAIETRRDALIELLTVHVEKDAHRLMRFDRRFHSIAVPFGEGASGCERNLKSARDPCSVTGHEPLCRVITFSELG